MALHNYGFTYLNAEALARGLGSALNAASIFDWLDNGTAQPTVMGGHVGSTDIYQYDALARLRRLDADSAWRLDADML